MAVDELKAQLSCANNGYDSVYVSDGFVRYSLDNIHIDDGRVELEYKNRGLDAYDFLRAFETIAVEYGLLLRMQRPPRRSGLLFYFIDMDTNQKSGMYVFYINHTAPSRIIEDLKKCAKEFKERIGNKND